MTILAQVCLDPKINYKSVKSIRAFFQKRKNNSCFCTDDMRDNLTGMIYPSMKPTRNISSIYTLCSNFNKFPYNSPVFQRKKTSQELQMLSRSLFDCKSLLLNVMNKFRNLSVIVNCVTNSLIHSQSKSKSKSLSL